LVGRIFQSSIDGLEMMAVYVGDRLGLYQALASEGASTATELAAKTGIHSRYAREWLEQQAVAGVLDVEDATVPAESRSYTLPPGHAEVLLDKDSLNYLAPLGKALGVVGGMLPTLLDAFRAGSGVSYSAYGREAREAQEALNRPSFLSLLTQEWLPSISDLHARLATEPAATVADVGCGAGWSSIAIAKAYPKVTVDGFDSDEPSILTARANAEAAGLADRVRFQVSDVGEPGSAGTYDLVTAFEMVHDLGRPVEALRTMRGLTRDGGTVLVMDERANETFAAPSDEIERFFYGISLFWCLPQGLADGPAGTGTVMRPDTLRNYAKEAGFSEIEILPIEHAFWRFYRLHV
jgi:2-polyprenyl-3-methyl-5-hydroxy-6-metoxy-1,4-benzoquinol methylase